MVAVMGRMMILTGIMIPARGLVRSIIILVILVMLDLAVAVEVVKVIGMMVMVFVLVLDGASGWCLLWQV